MIFTIAAADSVKRKPLPAGAFVFFLAEIAAACFATRRRLLVSLTELRVGGWGVINGGADKGWRTAASALTSRETTSEATRC